MSNEAAEDGQQLLDRAGGPERAVRHDGRVEGAVLRTVFPGNVVIASAQCRIEGGGACGEATRLRQWRQTISLDPDARAVVEGTIEAKTFNEAQVKHLEKDAALERRFQQVYVGEPSVEDAIGILRMVVGLERALAMRTRRRHPRVADDAGTGPLQNAEQERIPR